MKEIALVGFDAREMQCRLYKMWSQSRKETYLLRHDIQMPLSIDILVWPSIFDTEKRIVSQNKEHENTAPKGIPLPKWIGPNRPLWCDLESLEKYIDERKTYTTQMYQIIAITLLDDNLVKKTTRFAFRRSARLRMLLHSSAL